MRIGKNLIEEDNRSLRGQLQQQVPKTGGT